MFDLRNLALALVVGVLVGAVPAWWATASYKDARWTAAIEEQKVEAAVALQGATERAIAAERANIRIADKIEVEHAASKSKLDRALADNRRLTRELGGLRDPGHRPSCGDTVPADPATPGGVASPAADGRLSAEASEFLLEFARDADRAAEYAATCYQWWRAINPEGRQ